MRIYKETDKWWEIVMYSLRPIISPEMGSRLMSCIFDAAPGKSLDLRDYKFPDHDGDLTESEIDYILQNAETLDWDTYFERIWGNPEEHDVVVEMSTDKTIEVQMFQRAGGSVKSRRAGFWREVFFPNEVVIKIRKSCGPSYAESMMVRLMEALPHYLTCFYGKAGMRRDMFKSLEFYSHLPGVSWLTLFGNEIVEAIGRAKFDALPASRVMSVEDVGILVKASDSLEEYERTASQAQRRIMGTLGKSYFRPGLFVSPLRANGDVPAVVGTG